MAASARPDLPRGRVLAHRFRAQELDRPGRPADAGAAVTALGVADVPAPAARTALAVRDAPPEDLVLVWGARGAPALHRRADLQRWAAALWPLSDEDATRRTTGPGTTAGAPAGLEAYRLTARAVHEVLAEADGELVSKSALSSGVTARLPAALSADCPGCRSRHVHGQLLQVAGLAGGAELVRVGRAARFRALPGMEVPDTATGTVDVVRAALHLLGPATRADVATYLGTSATALRTVWPHDAVEVVVEGRTAWAAPGDLEALPSAPDPEGVRLLPPGDPWLQARDRELTVPAPDRRRRLWTAIGAPGAVLERGEVVGTWRARTAGRCLQVTLEGFGDLPARTTRAAAAEAERVAAARGLSDVRTT